MEETTKFGEQREEAESTNGEAAAAEEREGAIGRKVLLKRLGIKAEAEAAMQNAEAARQREKQAEESRGTRRIVVSLFGRILQLEEGFRKVFENSGEVYSSIDELNADIIPKFSDCLTQYSHLLLLRSVLVFFKSHAG
ncbi:hypothetical protein RND71_022084 [Anisodus tanguticus]|uniref:Uncharacterized protein n=1 Tax=Anisodus tanguticus TaxID=243964 RepID=A0AAE1RXU4_9SOLA|nr:hypothetical protein RND71_022084 [Anisodus tanguticus]